MLILYDVLEMACAVLCFGENRNEVSAIIIIVAEAVTLYLFHDSQLVFGLGLWFYGTYEGSQKGLRL